MTATRIQRHDYPRDRGGRKRICGRCGKELRGEHHRAFAVYEEPELNSGLRLCYRFCPGCWAIIQAALEHEGVEGVANH